MTDLLLMLLFIAAFMLVIGFGVLFFNWIIKRCGL